MATQKKTTAKPVGAKHKVAKAKAVANQKTTTKSKGSKQKAIKETVVKGKTIVKHKGKKSEVIKPKVENEKVSDLKGKKEKAIRSIELEKELSALKEETASLQAENARLAEQYGQMLEVSTNIKFKANAMLGQILKALYIMGIGPDDILAKCQQMFMTKVVAD